MKRYIRLIILCVLVLVGFGSSAEAAEVLNSGICGEHVSWVLTDDGTLTISGTGPMTDFASNRDAPWYDDSYDIIRIVVESGVTSIASNAFFNFTNLTEAVLPDTVTSIGDRAFASCFDLNDVNIPAGVTYIGSQAFASCSSLREVVIPGGVKDILESTFSSCHLLERVMISEGVETIGEEAFGSRELREIHIPSTVQSISENAFGECIGLDRIAVSEENPYYAADERGVLFNRDQTTLMRAPAGIQGEYVIPDTVTRITPYSFFLCTGLTKVTFPAGVTVISEYAFAKCADLTEVILPAGLTTIEGYAFAQCVSLKDIVFPEELTTINVCAFLQCTSLNAVTIPMKVSNLGRRAFEDCCNLSAITVDENNSAYCNGTDGSVLSKTGSTLIMLPGGIGSHYVIPEGVKFVSHNALDGITSLTVPLSVTSFLERALMSCDELRDIYYAGTEAQFSEIAHKPGVTFAQYLKEHRSDIKIHYEADGRTHSYYAGLPISGQANGSSALFQCPCGIRKNVEYSDSEQVVRQYACEAAGGIYFLEQNRLDFLDMNTGALRNVCVLPDCAAPAEYSFCYDDAGSVPVYRRGDLLYWADLGIITVFDLAQGMVADVVAVDGGVEYHGIGVDDAGRFYMSVRDDNGQHYLNLYSPEGVLLDQLEIEGQVYEFVGFAPGGEVYFEAYRNFLYYGYDHPMRSIFAAKVAEDRFVVNSEGYTRSFLVDICQIDVYEHQGNAQLFDGTYLATSTGYLVDVSGGLEGSFDTCFVVSHEFDEEPDSQKDDLSSVGVRMAYNPEKNTMLAYGSGRMIWEYDLNSGEALRSYQARHYVFSLLSYGDTFIAVEKEGGAFYIEQFTEADMTASEILVINLNEEEQYLDHTAENLKDRWEDAYITSHVPLYASEYSLDPHTPAVYTDEMKQAMVEYSNYLRWLGGLTPFESAGDAVWEEAAKGAVVLTELNELTHSPDQPAGMPDEFYEAGYTACSESNLSEGSLTESSKVMRYILGWLNDTTNVTVYAECGHRFNFLQRAGYQIAYGSTDGYAVQNIVDYEGQRNRHDMIDGVDNNGYAYSWPGAGAFPTDAIDTKAKWSINLNSALINIGSGGIRVTITDLETGMVYDQTDSVGSSNYLNLGYQCGMCYYFDAPEAESYAGKSYQVHITNLQLVSGQPVQIVYTVDFCTMRHDYECGVCLYCGEGTPSHSYGNGVCIVCGHTQNLTGDVNSDGTVNADDAVYLLYHALFGGEVYPVCQVCDFNGSGTVDADDAVYLLYYTLFGDTLYPLNP